CPTMSWALRPLPQPSSLAKLADSGTRETIKSAASAGDKALGFNFDAVSCESCKAFFRRNAVKGVEAFKCPYSGACSIDVSNRRFCKRCRLAKCFDIGMKREYILTEEEKLEKRKKIDQNKLIRTLESLQLLPKDLTPADLADRELLSDAELQDVKFILDAYARLRGCEAARAPGPASRQL
uniref:Nuclear receptor domain-containing protein n=1 Tax=Macrostomum lignano TaxID=282301 RepID=A0A1I8FSJ5_9PLAT